MRKLSRLEASKECRRVLNRNGVDLSYCQYTCSGYEVRLTGWLCKIDGSDFNSAQVEALIIDFKKQIRGINVIGEMENWSFNSEHISHLGEKAHNEGGAEENHETYVIDLDDFDFEAS